MNKKDLIEKYTDRMNDFKNMYNKGTDSAYGVWKTCESVIEDLKHLPETEEVEMMVCAALSFGDIIVVGKRHGDCLHPLNRFLLEQGLPMHTYGSNTQGFYTNKRRFINREDAFILAKENGQLNEKEWDRKDIQLYSEDLY